MKNKDLEKGYNESIGGKKTNRLAMILITSFSGVITITALVLYMVSNITIADKIKVFDSQGNEYKTQLMRQSELLKTSTKGHIKQAVYLANSFSRENYKTNQNQLLFLMDRKSAFRIFEGYKKEGAYNNALKLGHIYEVESTKVSQIDTSKEPYQFIQESIVYTQDGGRVEYFRIVGKGIMTTRKPSDNNERGLWISDYYQETTKINRNE